MRSNTNPHASRNIIILLVASLVVLSACAPAATPTPQPTAVPTATEEIKLPTCDPMDITGDGLTKITLADGTEIYLSEKAHITLVPAGYCPGISEHFITLIKGQIAIRAKVAAGAWVNVTNPDGFIARLNKTGAVTFDPVAGQFILDCTNGECTLGPNAQQFAQFLCGEGGGLSKNTTFPVPMTVDVNALKDKYGSWIVPVCAATATPTPPGTPAATGTPELAKTATSACATFRAKFPGTPCP